MTCEDVQTGEIVEAYLHDRLTDDSRDAFEQHYFECAGCFGLLQTYRDLQAELARTRDHAAPVTRRSWVWQWAWVPAAAAVCLAVGLTLWQRPLGDPSGALAVTQPSVPSVPERPSQPAPLPPAVSLANLARIDAPRYTPGRLRSAGDEATATFREAMTRYERGDYAAAVSGLRAAAALDPEAPHIGFFLGISHLLMSQPDAAIAALRQTLALGDSPFTEDAQFFLAKAHLRKEDVAEARTHLQRTVQIHGAREGEARDLLLQLERVR